MFGRPRRGNVPPIDHPPIEGDVISTLRNGEKATITEILGGHQIEARLMNMGLRPGKEITRLGAMPGGGPITVECDGFRVALGRGIAHRVKIQRLERATPADES